jgi:hypothetical protein
MKAIILVFIIFFFLIPAVVYGNSVEVTMPDMSAFEDSTFQIPVVISDVNELDLFSYQFTLHFDEDMMDAVGIETQGTLSESKFAVANTTIDGQIGVACYSTSPFFGGGNLIYLVFHAVGLPDSTSQLSFSQFMFNEGDPTAVYDTPLATVSIFDANDLNTDGRIDIADVQIVVDKFATGEVEIDRVKSVIADFHEGIGD